MEGEEREGEGSMISDYFLLGRGGGGVSLSS